MSSHEDRRDTTTQRIPFEAIVEIGAQGEGSAFEAQGVDVSSGGLHVRTAYLPELGQPLLCRFDAPGEEVMAEGDVVWRREEARGGEFGVRFTRIEGQGARALLDMCGVQIAVADSGPAGVASADPGTRVRLHIDGLASPMRARVRGVAPGELMVGSNLEFLRVGRALDLEDVDRGQKRAAHIDRVDVEVDPTTRVPQLVVTLRYDDMVQVPSSATMAETREATPQPLTIEVGSDASSDPGEGHASGPEARQETSAARTVDEASNDPLDDDEVETAGMMRSKLSQVALGVGPKIGRLGAQAMTAIEILRDRIRARRADASDETAPRRMTARAPGGVLHADGKRVVREEATIADDAAPIKISKVRRRIAAGGAAASVALVIGLVAMHRSAPPPGAEGDAAASRTAENAQAAAATAKGAGATAVGVPAGAITANVPLFGNVPLATAEPANAVPPTAPGVPGMTTALSGNTGASGSSTFAADEASGDDTRSDRHHDKGSSDSAQAQDEVKPLLHGKVVHPTTLRIKTDGAVTELHGSSAAGALTISIAGRKVAESGADLAARDERLRSVHVSNGSKGAEIVLHFKDVVPPYAVHAKGQSVQIALGRDDAEAPKTPVTSTTAKPPSITSNEPARTATQPHGSVAKRDTTTTRGSHRD